MTRKPHKHLQKNAEDDNALFRATVSDAKPLAKKQIVFPADPCKTPAKKVSDNTKQQAKAMPAAKSARPTLKAGVPTDLDRRTMDRLRKGKVRPDAQLDLHGMTADSAHDALVHFIENAYADGKRCVLVITGKGSLTQGGGIIRRELPAWLNAQPRSRLLGFAQAQPNDGGTGAFYILLKRKRQ